VLFLQLLRKSHTWSCLPSITKPATTYNYLEAIGAIHMLIRSSEKRKVDFNWGSEKIRGVNIGGWLVLEP
jgi:hypothetical protein